MPLGNFQLGLVLALVGFATGAAAEETVSQCIKQFVADCDAALTDHEAFLTEFAARDASTVYTTSDGTTRIAATTSADDLGTGAGVWARINVVKLGGAVSVACTFDCSLEDDADPEALRDQVFVEMDVIRSEASLVGGMLEGGDDSKLDVEMEREWWGSQVFFANGWATKPDHAAQITIHCCGLEIQSASNVGPGG